MGRAQGVSSKAQSYAGCDRQPTRNTESAKTRRNEGRKAYMALFSAFAFQSNSRATVQDHTSDARGGENVAGGASPERHRKSTIRRKAKAPAPGTRALAWPAGRERAADQARWPARGS